MPNKLYTYDGPVMAFDRIVCHHWHSNTYAPSLPKARSNLAYQFKKMHNMVTGTRLSLVGTVVVEEDNVSARSNPSDDMGEQIPLGI